MKLPLVPTDLIGPEEVEAAHQVLLSGRVTQGEKVAAFEAAFAEAHRYTADRAVFCNSGSSANLLAVTALDLKAEEEVIVSAVGWPTTIWPIVQCGGVPVLVDINPQTLEPIFEGVWTFLGPYRFGTHILGQPAYYPGAKKIEDCCEALDAVLGEGTPLGGMKVGTHGRFGTFSFYISHHITTIEGGMVLCRDAEDAIRLRMLRDHGLTTPREAYQFEEVGYNLRGDEVRAAIGLVQFRKRLPWVQRRREIAKFWTEALDCDIYQPIEWAKGAVPFAFPIVCRGDKRAKLMAHLEAHGIETRPLIAGNLARQPAMRKVKHRIAGPLTGADFLHDHAFYVGIHPGFTDEQVEYLPRVLREFA